MKKPEFQQRQKIILAMLQHREFVSRKEIAETCKVNERTIRNDIADINAYFPTGSLVQYQKNSGYQLHPEQDMYGILEKEKLDIDQNRIFYIIKELVFAKRELDLYDLAESLSVSEASIEKDLQKIKRLLQKEGKLKLKRHDASLYLEGDEKCRRSLLCSLFIQEAMQQNFDIMMFDSCFTQVDMTDIMDILNDVFHQSKLTFNDAIYLNIALHIAIASERVMNQPDFQYHTILHDFDESDLLIASDILLRLEHIYGIQFSQGEYAYLATQLHGKRTFRSSYENTKDISNFEILTQQLISYILTSYNIDFTRDMELHRDLSIHLQGMHARLRSANASHNVLMEEIRKNYPFIFEIGITLSHYYTKLTDVVMNEDEVGFIVLHLVCAFERYQRNDAKVRTIIVCPTGYSSSKIMEIKIHNAYPETIAIVQCCSIQEFQLQNQVDVDLVISTVPLPIDITCEIFVCSPFLQKEDLQRLDRIIHKCLQHNTIHSTWNFFEESLCFFDCLCKSQDEVINLLADSLYQKGYVDETYVKSVMQREAFSSTAYHDGFAIPHAMNMNATKTKVAIAVLRNPIVWGKNRVQIIFLLAFQENDKDKLFELYETFALLSEQRDRYIALSKTKTYQDFLQQLHALI